MDGEEPDHWRPTVSDAARGNRVRFLGLGPDVRGDQREPQPDSPQKAENPCIILRTKQVATLRTELVNNQGTSPAAFNALGAKDSDIMIVVRKPWPWDGKFGTGLK